MSANELLSDALGAETWHQLSASLSRVAALVDSGDLDGRDTERALEAKARALGVPPGTFSIRWSLALAQAGKPRPATGEPAPLTSARRKLDLEERQYRLIRARRRAEARLAAEEAADGWAGLPDAVELYDALEEEPTPFRVEGLVPAEAFSALVAQAKVGKTTLIGNFARSLLTGEDFLGRFGVRPLDGNVAMMNYEMPGRTLAGWYADMGLPRGRFHLLNLRGAPNPLASDVGRGELADLLRRRDVETLILDPFGVAYTGQSQNDPQEVRAWQVALDRLVRSAGVQDVVLAVHAGWEGGRVRGSTALKDHPDSLITLTREGDTRYLEAVGRDVEVSRGVLTMDPARRLTFTPGVEVQADKAAQRELRKAKDREDRDEVKAEEVRAYLESRPEGASKNAIYTAVKGKRGDVFRLIDLLAEEGELQPAKGGYALADSL